MIDQVLRGIFSMRMIAVALFIFLSAIAVATFIESDYGTPASKIAVYNATWFEILLIYLTLGMIANIFNYKLYRAEKIAVFAFHLSFIIIILGAGVTRFIGFEGQMPLKEGETSNIIYSADPYLVIRANDLVNQYELKEKRWLSEAYPNSFKHEVELPNNEPVSVEFVQFQESVVDTILINDSLKGKAIEFVVRGQNVYLFKGEEITIGNTKFAFDSPFTNSDVLIIERDNQLFIESNTPFGRVDMMNLSVEDRQRNTLDPSKIEQLQSDTLLPFYSGRLYLIGNESMVFREYRKHIGRARIKGDKREDGQDFLTIKLKNESEEKIIEIPARVGEVLSYSNFTFSGLNFQIGYGAKEIRLPFSVRCRDFILDRYPGSQMASSFASEVTVIDTINETNFDKRIFMNHVMDYNGYRFFQSSYFPDESGTILSVNADFWGTNLTYLGYLLMSVGMILSIFAPKGRMRDLNTLIKKSKSNRSKLGILICLISFSLLNPIYAHENEHDAHSHETTEIEEIDKSNFKLPELQYLTNDVSDEISDLLVQDRDGRIIPYHTMCDRVLRKVYYGKNYTDTTLKISVNAVQTVTSMHLYGPPIWNNKPIIYVSSKINDTLNLAKHVSIQDLENEQGQFKWVAEYMSAFEKPDSKKNEFDKQIIKLGERYRVLKDVLNYQFFRVVPVPGDSTGTWVWPFANELRGKDQKGNNFSVAFLQELYGVSVGDRNFSAAKTYLDSLKTIQWESISIYSKINPSADLPSKAQIKAEITYNKLDPFAWIKNGYFILGLLLLILFFIRVLANNSESQTKLINLIAIPLISSVILVFILHGIGLGFRSYISGYAPWSNGYEAVIFIAWATVLAGIIFIKKNPAVLAATVLLSGLMLFVTEMNLLDPEITPLQPVLKSYWLMIHVAIITSSYGFLGLGAILGFLNWILFIFRNQTNGKRITMNINELTAVNEMTLTIGVFMLTIGTFLGGVWANESWGRYWGWDPKETWALVSVLTYAVILHLRYIPGMNNKFLFNTVSFWGYSAILFTFFGVNFVLVGLHSYAQGDGVTKFPNWLLYTIFTFAFINFISWLISRSFQQSKKPID